MRGKTHACREEDKYLILLYGVYKDYFKNILLCLSSHTQFLFIIKISSLRGRVTIMT